MGRPRSFDGNEARRLLRRARTATLATVNRDDGMPYASLVNVATDVEGCPLILVSTLAWHTRNLAEDARASLMVAELPATGDALTGPRVTVAGRFAVVSDEGLKRRFLARHPQASVYAEFGDFDLWRMTPGYAHAIAGFGRIETLDANEVFPSNPEMVALEDEAIAHMNADHDDALQLYASKLFGATAGGWRLRGVDTDGADLVRGDEVLRLAFDAPVTTAGELRARFAGLGRRLRNDS